MVTVEKFQTGTEKNVKELNPPTHIRQIDVSRGNNAYIPTIPV